MPRPAHVASSRGRAPGLRITRRPRSEATSWVPAGRRPAGGRLLRAEDRSKERRWHRPAPESTPTREPWSAGVRARGSSRGRASRGPRSDLAPVRGRDHAIGRLVGRAPARRWRGDRRPCGSTRRARGSARAAPARGGSRRRPSPIAGAPPRRRPGRPGPAAANQPERGDSDGEAWPPVVPEATSRSQSVWRIGRGRLNAGLPAHASCYRRSTHAPTTLPSGGLPTTCLHRFGRGRAALRRVSRGDPVCRARVHGSGRQRRELGRGAPPLAADGKDARARDRHDRGGCRRDRVHERGSTRGVESALA